VEISNKFFTRTFYFTTSVSVIHVMYWINRRRLYMYDWWHRM